MKKLILLSVILFVGCQEDRTSPIEVECSQNEDGAEECFAECPEGYYFQENEDGEFECIECDAENCN